MLLQEFADDNELRVKLTGVVSQLRARLKDTGTKSKFNTKSLVALLHDNDIKVSRADLFDMIKQAPLRNLIKNIKGDDVIFVGQREDDSDAGSDVQKDKAEKAATVDKMAKRAAKK